jgi:hypothetical protein
MSNLTVCAQSDRSWTSAGRAAGKACCRPAALRNDRQQQAHCSACRPCRTLRSVVPRWPYLAHRCAGSAGCHGGLVFSSVRAPHSRFGIVGPRHLHVACLALSEPRMESRPAATSRCRRHCRSPGVRQAPRRDLSIQSAQSPGADSPPRLRRREWRFANSRPRP